MLQKAPFEPSDKVYLKLRTYKTAFLMASSTFSRCNDSLKLGECSVCVQNKGVTFIIHGLYRQDIHTHYGAKIFVPAFP